MKHRLPCLVLLSCLLSLSRAYCDDQEKAVKEMRKVSAMACDVTARGIVSRTMSDMLDLGRDQLVRERRAMNLNYGSLFLAHELTAKGTGMMEIALQLHAQKSMIQIANDRGVDWKQVLARAKKLNDKIEDNIYKHFLHSRADTERDITEKYDARLDWVKADSDPARAEIIEAQEIYVLWRERASNVEGQGSKVSTSQELASRRMQERTQEMRVPAPSKSPR